MRWNFTVQVTPRMQTARPRGRHEVSRTANDGRDPVSSSTRVARKFVKRRRQPGPPLYGLLVPTVRNVWRRPAKLFIRDHEPGHDCNTKLQTGRKFNSSIVRARAENYTEWMPSGMKLLFPPLPPTRNGNPGYVRRRVKHRFEISGVHDPAVSGRFVLANSLDFPHKFSTLLPLRRGKRGKVYAANRTNCENEKWSDARIRNRKEYMFHVLIVKKKQ